MPQQQQRPSFTPAFKKAFKDLTKLANTTEERLSAEFKDLSPKQRFIKLKQKMGLIQLIPVPVVITQATTSAVQKMTTVLTALNETMQDPTIGQQLTALLGLADDNARLAALKQLFLKDKVVEACANYLNMAIKSKYINKMDDTLEVVGANSDDAAQAINHVDSQGNYDPEKKVVRDLMRLLYELFDIVLIQAGYKPVFLPDSKRHGSGMWDPKKGVLFPD